MQYDAVEESLGYKFTDITWLKHALTHPSADQKKSTNLNYERLEYLGDAVLELVVSRELFSLFPKVDEGELTKLRSGIVSRKHLSEICRQLGWCDYLEMSPQLQKTGGKESVSTLANTFESVIGAVMMDSNYTVARKVTLHLLQHSLDHAEELKDVNYKGTLLEVLQAVNGTAPKYDVNPVDESQPTGPFFARVLWNGMELGTAVESSKHRAQVASAKDALQRRLWEKQ